MDLEKRLAGLELLLFDVDGILTDNGLYIAESGDLMKRFDVRDGAGLKLAQMAGLRVGLISGHDSTATARRASQLGIDICHVGVKDKIPVFESTLTETGVPRERVLYMGDDVMDLPLLTRAGVAVTVPEAPPLIRERCDFVTSKPGGFGAVRETVERVLTAMGRMDEIVQRFF